MQDTISAVACGQEPLSLIVGLHPRLKYLKEASKGGKTGLYIGGSYVTDDRGIPCQCHEQWILCVHVGLAKALSHAGPQDGKLQLLKIAMDPRDKPCRSPDLCGGQIFKIWHNLRLPCVTLIQYLKMLLSCSCF